MRFVYTLVVVCFGICLCHVLSGADPVDMLACTAVPTTWHCFRCCNPECDSNLLCFLHVQSFIKKYVQCYSCGNPETVVKIKKESIFLKCKACGAVSDVDMRHRLNTYILKNPPEEKVSKAEKK